MSILRYFKYFLNGAHHSLNGYNFLVIITMLVVLILHVTSGLTKEKEKPNFFDRYSGKQNNFKKARQQGYINYQTKQNTDGTWTISAQTEFFKKTQLKYKWILKKNINLISGNLDGELLTEESNNISIQISATDLNDYLIVLQVIESETPIRVGQMQAIRLRHEAVPQTEEEIAESQLKLQSLSKEERISHELSQNEKLKIRQ